MRMHLIGFAVSVQQRVSFGNILSARAPVDDNDVSLTMPGAMLRASKTLIGQQSLAVVSD